MKLILLFWFNVFAVILISCSTSRTLSEGISGKVLWFEGDLMPGINKKPVAGIPVKREIYIFHPTRTSQVKVLDQVFFREIQTDLVKKIWTDKNGNFKVKLPPGRYSIFTKEPPGFFSNRFSEEGFLNLVNVTAGEITDIVIRIDYMAAY